MKILSFVRSDVWQMRGERKALSRHLRDFKLDSEVKSQIINHPSKFADDPDFTITFIEEVGKNRETAAAAKGSAPFPTGNWLHVFEGFRVEDRQGPERLSGVGYQLGQGTAAGDAHGGRNAHGLQDSGADCLSGLLKGQPRTEKRNP